MKALLLVLLVSLGITGCYKSCAVGDPLVLFTYCPKDAYEALRNPKPYGAHWVKDGVTLEDRRKDSWECGAAATVYAADHVVFTSAQRESVRMPEDKNDDASEARLSKKWIACMSAKGYTYLKTPEECGNKPCVESDTYKKLAGFKPYGTHWVKDGITLEKRRKDSWECGAAPTVFAADHVIFTSAQRESVRMPEDKTDDDSQARLSKKWVSCMSAKGYTYLEECDERCIHP